LVAVTSADNHVSVGFSTTVFAILGILAGVETLARPKTPGLQFRHVNPLLAAFAVAVLIGIGENVDIKAHFFGFGFGALAGLATRRLPQALTQPRWQWSLGIAAYAAYAFCWNAAMEWFRF
jgi:rhomboid protease GluP